MKDLMPPINTPDNVFRDGNPATGQQGDIVPSLWLNNVQGTTRDTQKELISVLNEAGIAINESKNDQLLQAILQLTSTRSIPVGIPQPWPAALPPPGWLKCNGSAFNKALYPNLAAAYPNGVLPDLRGEFIRGWDDGRGVDVARALMSAQGDTIRNIAGHLVDVAFSQNGAAAGVFVLSDIGPISISATAIAGTAKRVFFDTSRVVPTSNENRPRNIAFNYIVRAA